MNTPHKGHKIKFDLFFLSSWLFLFFVSISSFYCTSHDSQTQEEQGDRNRSPASSPSGNKSISQNTPSNESDSFLKDEVYEIRKKMDDTLWVATLTNKTSGDSEVTLYKAKTIKNSQEKFLADSKDTETVIRYIDSENPLELDVIGSSENSKISQKQLLILDQKTKRPLLVTSWLMGVQGRTVRVFDPINTNSTSDKYPSSTVSTNKKHKNILPLFECDSDNETLEIKEQEGSLLIQFLDFSKSEENPQTKSFKWSLSPSTNKKSLSIPQWCNKPK